MADAKVTALTELTSVASTDILYVVDDPGSTPISKKATVSNVLAAMAVGNMPTAARTRTINVTFGGGSTAIATGIVKGDFMWDFAATLQSWTLLADQSGAIKVDIWVDTYANFPPTNDDSICNGNEPEITASGVKAQDTDLSNWSDVSIAAGDIWRLNVDSCSSITACTLCLKVLV